MRSDDCSVYHLRRGSLVSRIRKRDQPEVARALRLLGTSEVEEMLYDGTVFVEGEDDVELLEEAFPQSLARIKFKDLSGRGEVEKQIKRLQQAESEGQKENISYFLFDHDRQPTKLSSTLKVRVGQWDRYCIENYLLEPEILFDVIRSEKHKSFPSTLGEAEQLFRDLARRQLQYQTAKGGVPELRLPRLWGRRMSGETLRRRRTLLTRQPYYLNGSNRYVLRWAPSSVRAGRTRSSKNARRPLPSRSQCGVLPGGLSAAGRSSSETSTSNARLRQIR